MEEIKTEGQQTFVLQRIYVRDLSFESPAAPQVFTNEWKPDMNLELNTKTSKVDEKNFEVILSLTVTVKNADSVAFIVEIQQAGIFLIKGFDQKAMQHLVGSYCPNILFPFAREAVSDLVGKGGFPQLLLAPVNFDALFAEAVKKQGGEEPITPKVTH